MRHAHAACKDAKATTPTLESVFELTRCAYQDDGLQMVPEAAFGLPIAQWTTRYEQRLRAATEVVDLLHRRIERRVCPSVPC